MSTRRTFLRSLGAALAAAPLVPESVLADPYRLTMRGSTAAPVRVRGQVVVGGRGLAGVAVTDGFQVVATASDGSYQMVTRADRPFVYLTLPAGYRIPAGPGVVARFHQPLSPDAAGEAVASFDLETLPGGDERHTVLALPDIQTETAWEMARFHAETVPDLRATAAAAAGPVLGVSVGDIMFDDLSLYPEYERGVAQVGGPFFQVVGNHDLDFQGRGDEASTATFSRRFGPRYYSFDRGAVHYVVLDDVLWHGSGYIGYLGYDQLAWLEADLARVEPGKPVVVFLHIPALGSRHERDGRTRPGDSVSVTNREILFRLLEPFRAHLVSGHTHENDHLWHGALHEHVSGTVCGAWWSGDICADGTPNGYSVYEVAGEEVRWRYQATGMPADYQMRLYPRGADAHAPEEMVANVWDADERWTVVWYENGQRRGRMARRQGLDPRAVAEHSGPDRPRHRPWVDPYPTRHLYYAPVPPGHGALSVEATDPFGQVYRAALEE
ncbi:MAG: calcineurin-like phosphoesterase family protein [Longimicrobiales bacterium]|nr:calcineurin-like phosphoesterase family protein [Longimicrobiales bacterium]